MILLEGRLKKYFKDTGFDAIEIYYNKDDDSWTCCIMTGCQGEPKDNMEDAIISVITEGK